ncbi:MULTISPECIES: small acid-soluble spore protein O [Alteribacter]|uniref:Small acid-soluble spore protein O n=1 Tax=Alteribacter keqinensis TaxID=2483800 RepID=A0A3M7TX40_9BACI|nr:MULTISPECIES: small acid-soluble spore protein O [Alteribacter]MBM7094304.1 small acid-soluble spore protein O [Alteribacter salitolerans]RNA69462.1 small acid-soluble spore protein O [Alteribacter keqinensis]
MSKDKANHVRPGMNDSKAQGKGAGYNERWNDEPMSAEERMFNKKTKKRQ